MCGSAASRPVGGHGHVGLIAVSERKSYKTDLSDEQWALVEPVITAWKGAHPSVSGHQDRYAMREIVNALLYQGRTGCQWDLLPHDFPPPGAVKYYFYTWPDDGTYQTIHDLLRWQVRERMGRKADPSLVVLDTQSVHAAAGVPAESTGRDAGRASSPASAAMIECPASSCSELRRSLTMGSRSKLNTPATTRSSSVTVNRL
jgi:transposase